MARRALIAIAIVCLPLGLPSAERPLFTLSREGRPTWLREEGIVMAGSWEPLLFRVRRDGSPGYEATPEQRAAYEREHSEETLRALKALGVNFIMLHCYKGFGLEAERESMEDAKAFAELCRREGFRTGAYVFSGTIGWELFFKERPEASEWVIRDASGKPVPYGSATYRYYIDRNHPDAVEYLRRVVRFAVEDLRLDLLHFDNYHMGPGHGPSAAQAFRAWLAERYGPEALAARIGPGGLTAVAPPFSSSPSEALGRDYLRFQCDWLSRSYWDMARYARSLRPEILLECNPGGVGERARPPVWHWDLLRGGEAFWDEGPGPAWDGRELRTRIRTYKVGRSLGNMTFAYTTSPLEAAEAIAFNLDCLGCIAWFEYGRILAPFGKPVSPELKAWVELFRRLQPRWGGRPTIADVATLRPFAAQVFGSRESARAAWQAEEILIEGHVPFGIVGDVTLESLREFRTVLVAGCEVLANRELEAILEALRSGCGLVLVGRAGSLDEELRPRASNPIETWLGRPLGDEPFRAERGGARCAYFPAMPGDSEALVGAIRWAAGGRFSVEVSAPRYVACEFLRGEGGAVGVHFVNYSNSAAGGIEVRLAAAEGTKPRAAWIVAGSAREADLEARAAEASGDPKRSQVRIALPEFDVHGFLAVGAKGVEPLENAKQSAGGAKRTEVATFGGGCFWCVEAVLEQLDGVLDVVSGYMGGSVPNPTYEQVCTGLTGHAEVVQVTYDPEKIRYEELLEMFWKLHDPTSLNRQGNDIGPQYRSVIFYHSEEQKLAAEKSKAEKDRSKAFPRPIVTEIREAGPFYKAEEYHQDYYRRNPSQPYCRAVIAPKLDKLGLKK